MQILKRNEKAKVSYSLRVSEKKNENMFERSLYSLSVALSTLQACIDFIRTWIIQAGTRALAHIYISTKHTHTHTQKEREDL
jgi:hypothetical protein